MALASIPGSSDHSLSVIARRIRPCESLDIETSIARASEAFRDFGRSAIPITENSRYVGMIQENSLSDVIGAGSDLAVPVRKILQTHLPFLTPNSSFAEALRMFADSGYSTLAVVSLDGRPLGTLSPSDLVSRRLHQLRPKPIGGMATPLGVYLSNGIIKGGASSWGLMLTGALLFTMLFGADLITTMSLNKAMTFGMPRPWLEPAAGFLSLALFMLALRLIPLAGTHAAEHMVVHAIERGEDLTPEIVSRMPRVHPRCGTNIAAGASIFLGIFGSNWSSDVQLKFLVAALATLFLWRPVGSLLQFFVTTKRPTKKQLDDGIRAGKELLDRYEKNPVFVASPWMRIYNSGMLHIIIGSTITAGLLELASRTFGLNDWLRVYF